MESGITAEQYVALHNWYTQGLSLGQIDVDAYKQAVLALCYQFAQPEDIAAVGVDGQTIDDVLSVG